MPGVTPSPKIDKQVNKKQHHISVSDLVAMRQALRDSNSHVMTMSQKLPLRYTPLPRGSQSTKESSPFLSTDKVSKKKIKLSEWHRYILSQRTWQRGEEENLTTYTQVYNFPAMFVIQIEHKSRKWRCSNHTSGSQEQFQYSEVKIL